MLIALQFFLFVLVMFFMILSVPWIDYLLNRLDKFNPISWMLNYWTWCTKIQTNWKERRNGIQ